MWPFLENMGRDYQDECLCTIKTAFICVVIDLQVVLSFEGLRAHTTHVFALVAVGEFVFGQRRCISKHFIADLW